MKKIFLKIGILIFFTFLISLVIDYGYRHRYGLNYELPQNIWILPETKDKYEIVKVGNSHAEDGINFERYNLKSLSLASSAQSFDYDLAYLKMYSRQIKEGAVIIINISPLDFSQKKAGREDSLQTNYYDGRISPFLIPNLKIEDYLQSRIFPFLRAGYLWREKNKQIIKERISKEEKGIEHTDKITKPTFTSPTPPQAISAGGDLKINEQLYVKSLKPKLTQENYFFNVEAIYKEINYPSSVPPNIHEASVNFIFDKWYHSGGFGPEYFAANKKDLEKLIDYCLKKKWRPVMITIPITQVLLKALQPDYMQVYIYNNLKLTKTQGVHYLDFSRDTKITTNNSLFGNSDHLNHKGAKIFSYFLLHKLIQKGYLSKDVDKYDYTPLENYQL